MMSAAYSNRVEMSSVQAGGTQRARLYNARNRRLGITEQCREQITVYIFIHAQPSKPCRQVNARAPVRAVRMRNAVWHP